MPTAVQSVYELGGQDFILSLLVGACVCRLEDGLVLEPVHYFARRTLLQDSPDGRAGDNVCLRTRIQMLLEKLRPGGENNPDTILSVCAMNQAAKSPAGRWHSKSIFVHSKVVMVDDKLLVVGSANLNDRSFVGDRDSELGVLLCATSIELFA